MSCFARRVAERLENTGVTYLPLASISIARRTDPHRDPGSTMKAPLRLCDDRLGCGEE